MQDVHIVSNDLRYRAKIVSDSQNIIARWTKASKSFRNTPYLAILRPNIPTRCQRQHAEHPHHFNSLLLLPSSSNSSKDLPHSNQRDIKQYCHSLLTSKIIMSNTNQENSSKQSHSITFTVTSPDSVTRAISSDQGQEALSTESLSQNEDQDQDHNDNQEAQNETNSATNIVSSSPGTIEQPVSITPFIFEGENEQIVFNNVDENPWKYFVSRPEYIKDSGDDEDTDDENGECWVEFEHEGQSPWGQTTDGTTEENDDTASSKEDDKDTGVEDEEEPEIDLPLFQFQPLPIGPYGHLANSLPSSSSSPTAYPRGLGLFCTNPDPTDHPHPCPKVTCDATTGLTTVTRDEEENWSCTGFQIARLVAQMAEMSLPLHRRVHELQGHVEENRRGSREWRAHRAESMRVRGWGSSLWESHGVDDDDEEENEGEEGENE